jgi:hypothetical protein
MGKTHSEPLSALHGRGTAWARHAMCESACTEHIYTQTIHRTTQLTKWEECGPCPVFASYTLAFDLQLRKKHGKPSVRVENRTGITIRIHKHDNKNI